MSNEVQSSAPSNAATTSPETGLSAKKIVGNLGILEIADLAATGYAAYKCAQYGDTVLVVLLAVPAVYMLSKAAKDDSTFGADENTKPAFGNLQTTELLTIAAQGYVAYKLYDDYQDTTTAIVLAAATLANVVFAAKSNKSIVF